MYSAQVLSLPSTTRNRLPYGLPVCESGTAQRIEYVEPNGTSFGVTDAVIRGMWVPVTAIDGPLYGVGSVMLPLPGKNGPVITPVTVKVPLAVEGTCSGPLQVPFVSRGRFVDNRTDCWPLPPVRSRITLTGVLASSGVPVSYDPVTVTVTGAVLRPLTVTAVLASVTDEILSAGSGAAWAAGTTPSPSHTTGAASSAAITRLVLIASSVTALRQGVMLRPCTLRDWAASSRPVQLRGRDC